MCGFYPSVSGCCQPALSLLGDSSVPLNAALWFPLQTAVLQNLLGYLALDSLRRALLIKVRAGGLGGEVAAVQFSVPAPAGAVSLCSRTLLLLLARAPQCHKQMVIYKSKIFGTAGVGFSYVTGKLPSREQTKESWIPHVSCVLHPSRLPLSSLGAWLGRWQQVMKGVESSLVVLLSGWCLGISLVFVFLCGDTDIFPLQVSRGMEL